MSGLLEMATVLLLSGLSPAGPWESLNPGGGGAWEDVFSLRDALRLRKVRFYDPERMKSSLEAIAVCGTAVIVSVGLPGWSRAMGVYIGRPAGDRFSWSDFTENLYFPSFINSKIRKIGGKEYIYIATNGTGAWRRSLP